MRLQVLALVTIASCTQPELEKPSSPKCSHELFAGFATPEEAYATYATALNAQDYCRAANTYAREQRPDLATSAFAGLVFPAGTTDGPKHAAYLARFRQLCAKYELGCDSDQRVGELVRELRAGKTIQSLEPKLPGVAQRVPEDIFSDVMKTLADVEPNAIGQLSPTLNDLKLQGERATALAERAGRRGTPVFMIKGSRGWMLAMK